MEEMLFINSATVSSQDLPVKVLKKSIKITALSCVRYLLNGSVD